MDKDFNSRFSMGTNIADFRKGQFPRQDDLCEAQLFEETNAVQIRNRHLRAAVERQIRGTFPGAAGAGA